MTDRKKNTPRSKAAGGKPAEGKPGDSNPDDAPGENNAAPFLTLEDLESKEIRDSVQLRIAMNEVRKRDHYRRSLVETVQEHPDTNLPHNELLLDDEFRRLYSYEAYFTLLMIWAASGLPDEVSFALADLPPGSEMQPYTCNQLGVRQHEGLELDEKMAELVKVGRFTQRETRIIEAAETFKLVERLGKPTDNYRPIKALAPLDRLMDRLSKANLPGLCEAMYPQAARNAAGGHEEDKIGDDDIDDDDDSDAGD